MQQRARAYQVIGNKMYKTSVTRLLHCLGNVEGTELLPEIRSDMCEGGGTLALESS
jgi:hypothetical protein